MATVQLLLVDDEERFLATTKTLLQKRGIDVLTATSGAEAIEIMDRNPVDVVVLDVKMPGLDGVEVLRRLKQDHPLVEVIMLTGHASVETAFEGMKLGALDYVTKPCDVADLLQKINEAYAKKQAAEEKIRLAELDMMRKSSPTPLNDDEQQFPIWS